MLRYLERFEPEIADHVRHAAVEEDRPVGRQDFAIRRISQHSISSANDHRSAQGSALPPIAC